MSYDVLDLVMQAGLIVKLVLLLLAAFSVASWAIIATKWMELRGAEQDSEAFLEVYHGGSFDKAFDAARHLDRGPLAVIFLNTCNEITRMASRRGGEMIQRLDDAQLRRLGKVITWTAGRERQRLERGLTFLATVGSSAPFIGLFGTVVGIIATFQGIGATGSASLAVVGPGMAEALIATGVGLLAAIPATIAYNAYVARIDVLDQAIGRFSAELDEDLAHLESHEAAPRPRVMGE